MGVDFGGLKLDDPGGGGGAGFSNNASFNLAVDISTTAVPPVYTVFTSLGLTTLLASSYLKIEFYAAWRHTGAFGGNVAVNFRFLRNGVLMPASRGVTDNASQNMIQPVAFMRRIVVAAGLQTITVEWAGFALGVNTLDVPAGTLPDLAGAQLMLSEEAT